MNDFKDRKVTVAGLGVHGGAVGNIRWLHEQGALLTVTDIKSADQLQPALTALADLSGIGYVLGEHRLEDFTNTHLVLRNPAMRSNNQYLEAARRAGVPVEMDSSLFFKYSPTHHIIGVTGSKGKTSTTHAIAGLMSQQFNHTVTVGVEGTSPLAALSQLRVDDLVVFELSSWRLEALDEHKISPQTAVITSIYHDHLNTYDSFENYVETKKTMIRYHSASDLALLNFDDEAVRSWNTPALQGKVAWYTLGETIPGDGVFIDRGQVVCRVGKNIATLFPLSSLNRTGAHEQRNILPGIYLAWMHGVVPGDIERILKNAPRLAHRLEPVRELHKVKYVNDSAATIPEATMAALAAYKDHPILLIAGGNDKELNFTELGNAVAKANMRAVIFLPGDATEKQHDAMRKARIARPIPFYHSATMPEAVRMAAQYATPEDVVLLSPAATSFGLFQHEFDRGDQFKAAVNALE